MADWVSAAATGLAALGNLFTAGQSKSLTREGWRLQQAENQKNREYMSDEWTRQFEMQNAYNDPSAQVQRLINAGINPSEVFGSGTNTTAMSQGSPQASAGSSIPISSPQPIQYLGSQFVNDLAIAVRALTEADKNEALTPVEKEYKETLTKQLAAETEKVGAEKESIDLQNQLTRIYGDALRSREVQKFDAEIRRLNADAEVLIQQKDYVSAQKKVADMEALLKHSQRLFTDAQTREINTLLEPKFMKLQAEINNLDAQSGYYRAQGSYVGSLESGQRAINDMLRIDSENKFATQQEELLARIDELETTHLLKQETIERIRKAVKENKYFEFKAWMDAFESGSRIFSNIGSGASGIGGHHNYTNSNVNTNSRSINESHVHSYSEY